jgi:hypothetical protein
MQHLPAKRVFTLRLPVQLDDGACHYRVAIVFHLEERTSAEAIRRFVEALAMLINERAEESGKPLVVATHIAGDV